MFAINHENVSKILHPTRQQTNEANERSRRIIQRTTRNYQHNERVDVKTLTTTTIPTMSRSIDHDASSVAHVSFRVRCEYLGHGESVFLVRGDDADMANVSKQTNKQRQVHWFVFQAIVLLPQSRRLCGLVVDDPTCEPLFLVSFASLSR